MSKVTEDRPFGITSPKTSVYTSNGWKKIGEIVVGDSVLTHKGRFREVSGIPEIEYYEGECIRVVTYGSRIPSVPPHQLVLAKRGWMAVGDLRVGDRIGVSTLMPVSKDRDFYGIKWLPVKNITSTCRGRVTRRSLYNLVVEEHHSFVAIGPILRSY